MSLVAFHTDNPDRSKNIAATTIGMAGTLVGIALPVMKQLGVQTPSWRFVWSSATVISSVSLLSTALWLRAHSTLSSDDPTSSTQPSAGSPSSLADHLEEPEMAMALREESAARQLPSWDAIHRKLRAIQSDLPVQPIPSDEEQWNSYLTTLEARTWQINESHQRFDWIEAVNELLFTKYERLDLTNQEIKEGLAVQGSIEKKVHLAMPHHYHWMRGVHPKTAETREKADHLFYDPESKEYDIRFRFNIWCRRCKACDI